MQKKNELGKIEISKNAVNDICNIATKNINGIFPLKKGGYIAESTFKDNVLTINVEIKAKIGIDVVKTSNKIQSKIHELVFEMLGIDCKKINIEIVGFIN